MATDATGVPTSLGIPKVDPAADAPSGLGTNASMDSIDALLLQRVLKPAGVVSGEVPVWNGTTWVRSSATNVAPSSLGSGSPSVSTYLRGDGTWAPLAIPRVYVTKSAVQTLTTSTPTALTFNQESFDTDTMHDTVTNNHLLTAKTAGVYLFVANIIWTSNSVGQRIAWFGYNGGASNIFETRVTPTAGNSTPHQQVVGAWPMAVNDTMQLVVFQDSGGNLDVNNIDGFQGTSTSFSMVRIGS
jgi:hypothetical protein